MLKTITASDIVIYTVNSVHQHIIQYYSVLIIHLLPVATLLNLAQ